MKKILKMLMIVVIFAVFSLNVSAKTADEYINEFEEILPDENSDVTDFVAEGGGIDKLLSELVSVLGGKLPSVLLFFLSLIGIILIMSTLSFIPDGVRETAEIGVSVISALFVASSVVGVFSEVITALSEVNVFLSSAIPVMSVITLAGGGVKGAATQAAGMNLVLSAVGGGFGTALSLLCGFSLAMGLAASFGGEGNRAVGRYAKGLFGWVFGIATALFMGVLSLQTFISASSDSAAMRTAKYMASGTIPLVGGTVSASLSTLASGLSYAKGVVGASAVIVMLTILLSPFVITLLYRLALSVASGVAGLLGVRAAETGFSAFRSSFDLLIGVYGLSSVLYIFEIILFIKSGVALI